MPARVRRTFIKDFQVFLSLSSYFLTLHSSRSLFCYSTTYFPGSFSCKLAPPFSNIWHILRYKFSSILSSLPNCSNFLFCKYYLIFLNFIVFLLLSSCLILHYHLVICGLFPPSLISLSPLSCQVLLLHSITLRTEAKYNPPFPCKANFC